MYTDGSTSDTVNSTSTSVSLTGLSANTPYTVSIRTICDVAPNADTSSEALVSLTTNCDAITSFPYAQPFTNSTDASLRCWTIINNGGTNTWQHNAFGGGVYLLFSDIHEDYLISPQFQVTSGTSDRISIDARINNPGETIPLIIGVSTTGTNASDFTMVDTFSGLTQTFTPFTYDLTAYVGQDVYVALFSDAITTGTLIIDNFQIFAVPQCDALAGVTATAVSTDSVDVTVNDPNNAGAYFVTYQTGTTLDTVSPNPSTTSFGIGGLTANTSYSVSYTHLRAHETS